MSDFHEMYEALTKGQVLEIYDPDIDEYVPLNEFKKDVPLNHKPYKEEIPVWEIN